MAATPAPKVASTPPLPTDVPQEITGDPMVPVGAIDYKNYQGNYQQYPMLN